MGDEAVHYMESTSAEKLAQRFHEAYERLAPEFGYKTREASAVPWEQVPADNKALMVAVAIEVLGASRESTSRLKAENEDLREQLKVARLALDFSVKDVEAAKAEADVRLDSERVEWTKREQAEATMREVAEELRVLRADMADCDFDGFEHPWDARDQWIERIDRIHADRLDPPPVVEKPLHAYFPSDVDAGSRSPCVHCGQAYDAHVPPPVVENPPA